LEEHPALEETSVKMQNTRCPLLQIRTQVSSSLTPSNNTSHSATRWYTQAPAKSLTL